MATAALREEGLTLALIVVLASACYDKNTGGTRPDPNADQNGDGAPEGIGPDPVLDDRTTDPPPGDHDADGLPDDVDVDDDNDLVLDELPARALIDAVRPLARAECEAAAGCCESGWTEDALVACALRATGHQVVALAQSWADGYFRVEPEGLPACIEDQALDCSLMNARNALGGCSEYFLGQQVQRAPCNRTVDCARGFACSIESEVESGGRDATTVSEPAPYYVRTWEASGRLDGGTCIPFLGVGEPCEGTGQMCLDGLVCDDRVDPPACRDVADLGESCIIYGGATRSDDCAPGAYCDDAVAVPVCTAGRAPGEECNEDRLCLARVCDERAGKCQEPGLPADTCQDQHSYE